MCILCHHILSVTAGFKGRGDCWWTHCVWTEVSYWDTLCFRLTMVSTPAMRSWNVPPKPNSSMLLTSQQHASTDTNSPGHDHHTCQVGSSWWTSRWPVAFSPVACYRTTVTSSAWRLALNPRERNTNISSWKMPSWKMPTWLQSTGSGACHP